MIAASIAGRSAHRSYGQTRHGQSLGDENRHQMPAIS
jgi:hypothetical protein